MGVDGAAALAGEGARSGTGIRVARWSILLLVHAGLLCASIALAGRFDHGAWLALSAAAYAFASVHIGYHGHDLDHGQVPVARRFRDPLGLLCWNLLLGVSLQWWREKHNAHHRHTHVDGEDPDLYALFAYDPQRARALTGLHRGFVAWQAWLFWPVTAFARVYYQGLSLWSALHLPWRQRVPEVLALCVHHAAVWIAAWSVLGRRAVVFIAIAQALSGLYMGLAFATNHLGMPLARASGVGKRWQIPHTRNIRAGRLGTYLLGGLNLQIEHHLYPAMDRAALRATQPAVERACREAGIPYRHTGLLRALLEVQQSLHRVAMAARTR